MARKLRTRGSTVRSQYVDRGPVLVARADAQLDEMRRLMRRQLPGEWIVKRPRRREIDSQISGYSAAQLQESNAGWSSLHQLHKPFA